MTAIEQENLRVAKHTLAVIAGYGPETGTTLMQLAAREGLRIIEANEARARMETRPALSPKGNPCLHHPDGCLRAADNSECWPCDHAGRSPAYVDSLCEHVPNGFACEICNHDGVQR